MESITKAKITSSHKNKQKPSYVIKLPPPPRDNQTLPALSSRGVKFSQYPKTSRAVPPLIYTNLLN